MNTITNTGFDSKFPITKNQTVTTEGNESASFASLLNTASILNGGIGKVSNGRPELDLTQPAINQGGIGKVSNGRPGLDLTQPAINQGGIGKVSNGRPELTDMVKTTTAFLSDRTLMTKIAATSNPLSNILNPCSSL